MPNFKNVKSEIFMLTVLKETLIKTYKMVKRLIYVQTSLYENSPAYSGPDK
jgi:hypothetical protein